MAGVTRKYIALTGITFDARKLRVEAGDELPDAASQAEIEMLLEEKAIRLKDESEGQANDGSSGR